MALKKETTLGHCTPISSVVRNVRGTISQAKNLPVQLEKLVAISSKGIEPAQQSRLEDLVRKYQDVFDTGQEKGDRTKVVQHKIDTEDARPTNLAKKRLTK